MSRITEKIEAMIKQSIINKGLVKSGRMLNSIKVTESISGYSVNAVHYFVYLNDEHDIINDVLNSPELKLFIETILKEDLENALKL